MLIDVTHSLAVIMTRLKAWDQRGENRCGLDQHAQLDFYSASSLKQQSAYTHVATLGHILIPSQPVFVLSP
jgi:hypothetical protein